MKLEEKTVNVKLDGRVLKIKTGTFLSEITDGEKPCGGHGKCGKCKVVAKGTLSAITSAEKDLLTSDEIERGMRLACLTSVIGDCDIFTFRGEEASQIVTDGRKIDINLKPLFTKYGVSIDVGTTTLAARLYDVMGRALADAVRINPEIEWGADVISRIEASLSGKAKDIAFSIRCALNEMILELSKKAGIDSLQIDALSVTGNTAMLYLLTSESVESLSRAPFLANRLFGEIALADDLSISALLPDTEIYLLPCISAFVGADTTAAILATALCKSGKPLMLADIGTNGEIALWDSLHLTVCSTAAGPAFEGVEISMGMRGAVGAIDRVSFCDGKMHVHVIGDTEPKGICGSGLVDAVACMLESDVIDKTGFLEDEEFTILPPVKVNQKDIRMVQLAKSAICAGMRTLLDTHKIDIEAIEALYIAGGFGNYLNAGNAEKIGLLPKNISEKMTAVGNAALDGASMVLLNADLKEECERIARGAELFDLPSSKMFSDYYIEGMTF